MPVTIKDIARETGLSPATISKYINHKPIQEKNKKLIEAAIEKLDYHPNYIARNLRAKKTKTIAVLMPSLGEYFWGETLTAMTRYLFQREYMVTVSSYFSSLEKEYEVIQNTIAKNVDGVILISIDSKDTQYKILQDAGIPVVVLDQQPDHREENPVDCVRSDNYKTGRKSAEYLLRKGHRRFAIMGDAPGFFSTGERIAGFLDVCREQKGVFVEMTEPICFEERYDSTIRKTRKSFRELMKKMDPPTAIFSTNYITSIGIITEAAQMGVLIPEQVMLIGYDDDELFESIWPPIPCFAQKLTRMGEEAAELVLRRVHGDYSDFPTLQVIDTVFLGRDE